MESVKAAKVDHLERTAKEPRNQTLHTVIIEQINQINDTIRIFRLQIPKGSPPVKFLPGQWVDLFCPDIPKAGGFTITSPPSRALATPEHAGFIELAIQKSPDNPPAQWLWRPEAEILGRELQVGVGGSFVYPPPGIMVPLLRKLVFVAGGVGINPLMSMLSHIAEQRDGSRLDVRFLYAMKDPGGERAVESMLFVERLARLFARGKVKGRLSLFLTGGAEGAETETEGVLACNEVDVAFSRRRVGVSDLVEAVGQDRRFAAVYVCGVPTMTDEFVKELVSPKGIGMDAHRVLCERWW